jgi:hypothetical protein
LILAHEIGADRQLAMAAIDQDGELDLAWPAEIVQGIHRGANRSSAEEDVVDEHDGLAGDVEGNNGGLDIRRGALIEVVTMHADIEAADRDRMFPNIGEYFGEALGEGNAAALDSDQDDIGARLVALGNFVGHPYQSPANGGRIQDLGGVRHIGKKKAVLLRTARQKPN